MDETRFARLLSGFAGFQRARVGALSPPARTMHRWILRHFADTSTAPPPEVVEEWAVDLGADPRGLLAQLVDVDLVDADPDAVRVHGAYPFADRDRGHHVAVEGRRTVYAYCAAAALGIPAMLRRDATISSADPHTGQQVRVAVRGGQARWQPSLAMVSVPRLDGINHAGNRQARSGEVFCPTANFYADADAGRAYAATQHLDLELLTMPQALRAAAATFRRLLKP